MLRPLERLLYRVTGVDEDHEMRWTEYAVAMLLFSGASMLLLYLLQRAPQVLPWWNPQKFGGVPPALAFNTAKLLRSGRDEGSTISGRRHALVVSQGLDSLGGTGGHHPNPRWVRVLCRLPPLALIGTKGLKTTKCVKKNTPRVDTVIAATPAHLWPNPGRAGMALHRSPCRCGEQGDRLGAGPVPARKVTRMTSRTGPPVWPRAHDLGCPARSSSPWLSRSSLAPWPYAAPPAPPPRPSRLP